MTPPIKPDGLKITVKTTTVNRRTVSQVVAAWNDNSITETSFALQRSSDGKNWTDVGTSASPLDTQNTHGPRTLADTTASTTGAYLYRVAALNTVGYGGEFPSMTSRAVSDAVGYNLPNPPAAPTQLTALSQNGAGVLSWTDNSTNETGFTVERSTTGGPWTAVGTAPAHNGNSKVTFTDPTVKPATAYSYRVAAVNLGGTSAYSNVAALTAVTPPAAPTGVTGKASRVLFWETVSVKWNAVPGATGYTVQWSNNGFATVAGSTNAGGNSTQATTPLVGRQAWQFRVGATNAGGTTWSAAITVPSA